MALITYLLYAIITVTTLAWYFVKKRMNYWKQLGIPHDEPSLMAGNFQGLMTTRSFADCTREPYEKHKGSGPFCGFYFFQRPAVLVLETELAKNILIKDFSKFTDRGLFHNEKTDPLTGHLFLLDGAKWKNLRNKLSPTFTSGKMRFMYPTIMEVAENFVRVFGELSQKNKNNVVEIKELLARFTTDVIGKCAFGIECNSLKDPNAEFRIMGKRSLSGRRHGKLLTGFIQGFPNLAKKLDMRMVPDDVNDFFMRIVRETVAYREQNNIKANDFLSILIDLKNGEGKSDGVTLSLEEMAAQAFVFFVGGFETSSSTMGFALYELALNQDVQDRMREEINEAFNADGSISYETLHGLPYLGQVISETLRKYTIVPHLNRQALVDYVVPGNPKYVIPKGMPVLIPAYGMHHDPDLYPNPEKFDPDRFEASAVKQRETVEFLAFGDGPRNCIGMRFGIMQTRAGMAYLLRNFKFSVCEETEIPLTWDTKSFVLCSKNGIFLKVDKL
uniref:Cytochrome P450 n=1 Tax=Musca domestica TaxID=7370 RepID=A0A1I8MZ63_MUSDO